MAEVRGRISVCGTATERATAAMTSVIAAVVLTFTTRMRTRRVCRERVLSGPS